MLTRGQLVNTHLRHTDENKITENQWKIAETIHTNLYLNSFHLLARKTNLEKCSIYSNKFFHNFRLSESSFTCPRLRASGLVRRLHVNFTCINQMPVYSEHKSRFQGRKGFGLDRFYYM